VGQAFADWRATAERLEALRQADDSRSQRIELLRYQVEELTALRLAPDEWERIEAEHRRLTHAGRLIELCQNALQALYEGEGETLHGGLVHVIALLEQGRRTDAGLEPALELLRQAEILLHEGVDQLRNYARSLELDPERLAEVESRLTTLHDAARKYRVHPEKLPELCQQRAEELARLEGEGESLEALEAELATLEAAYRKAARELSASRRPQDFRPP
ncbi:MAG: DNA repair protein RecN, partial [Halothiobacillaceae bacterium]